MRNNPDDLANQCIEKIINWLNDNIDMYDNEKDYYYYNNYLATFTALVSLITVTFTWPG